MQRAFQVYMKYRILACAAVVAFSLTAWSQGPPPSAVQSENPVVLDWTPPALGFLAQQAAVKNSFTLDRNMLHAAGGALAGDDEPTKQAIGHLDGLSVHMLKFGDMGVPDENAVTSIREAYHLRGWKHVVTSTSHGGPVHNGNTDVWVVMDGVNVRGAVVLAETPKSVTLVTVAGDLSPIDLLHLRGHFGIPKFDGDNLAGQAQAR
ncbi:hypothetical protein [Occallatibacter riparius]|uniref:DUF4252 domain-containing protein n=1 Tax=Occallatibacter riparius TaxID=1002689 RepID=A0A9J7BL92_9BACT|nr:hypothetical protein [Occallatibacter riparius]UWZ83225.1 hypothetical protein MOP44_21970 [Occallatibacter riparius]